MKTFIQRALLILFIFVAMDPQENRSEFADTNVTLLHDDSDGNSLDYLSNELTSSSDSTTKTSLHSKTTETRKCDKKPKHFGYGTFDGPAKWPKLFTTCGGSSQSPIVLDTTTAITKHHPRFIWWNYSLRPHVMTLTNNGHTVVLTAHWQREEDRPYHWPPSSSIEYVFDQLHFHWGEYDHTGSEHWINNEQFPLELHAVHHRRDLHSVENAGCYKGGIRVIGVLYRISAVEHNNTGLQEIIPFLKMVRQAHTSTVLPRPFPLSRLIPQFHNLFFMYNGSLTTPPCSESVSWVVGKEPLTVSSRQLEEFRKLKDYDGLSITHNYRRPQPLNSRTVIQVR